MTYADAKDLRLHNTLMATRAGAPRVLFTVNTKTGELKDIFREHEWLGHLQFSPTDPQPHHVLPRGHVARGGSHLDDPRRRHGPDEDPHPHDEHGNRRPRVLLVRRHDRSGTTCRRRAARISGWPATGSPPASAPGITCSATNGRCTSTCRPTARCSRATAATAKWWRARPTANGSICSGRSACRTWPASRPPIPTSLIDTGFFHSERLVNMSKHDYRLEPNVTFSPDMKWIVFRSNMLGRSMCTRWRSRKAQLADGRVGYARGRVDPYRRILVLCFAGMDTPRCRRGVERR